MLAAALLLLLCQWRLQMPAGPRAMVGAEVEVEKFGNQWFRAEVTGRRGSSFSVHFPGIWLPCVVVSIGRTHSMTGSIREGESISKLIAPPAARHGPELGCRRCSHQQGQVAGRSGAASRAGPVASSEPTACTAVSLRWRTAAVANVCAFSGPAAAV